MNRNIVFPAEWYPQSGVMLTWPHEKSDWFYMLEEVEGCFLEIAAEISKREKLLIVCPDKKKLLPKLINCRSENLILEEIPANDTWARDHGAITVFMDGQPVLYDFCFNGWGMKFAANLDNQITRELYKRKIFRPEVSYDNKLGFVFEGGSIESDGNGTLMTTKDCLLSSNRNDHLTEKEIEFYLKETFGAKQVLWLSSGYLAGDDTDSHIDTLARLCDENTIAYVRCEDPSDEHYQALMIMEEELRSFKTLTGDPYRLIPLPMADPVYEEGCRIPATYANFLILNDAVLLPTYNSIKDQLVVDQLKAAFPDRDIISINCLPLIKQHGSLHCVTMQFPEGILS